VWSGGKSGWRPPQQRPLRLSRLPVGGTPERTKDPLPDENKPPADFSELLERVMGIEPTLSAWEAEVLPLNYTRKGAGPAYVRRADQPSLVRVSGPAIHGRALAALRSDI
jgi:hypothetical protein